MNENSPVIYELKTLFFAVFEFGTNICEIQLTSNTLLGSKFRHKSNF